MKPLSVLLLVLAAVGVLFFAITNLPGSEEEPEGVEAGSTPAELALQPDGPVGGGTLPQPDRNDRGSVDVLPTPSESRTASATGDGWQNLLGGKVVDENGAPVSGADVVLTRSSAAAIFFVNTDRDRSADRKVRTTSAGVYTFENVEPYDYYALEVDHENFSRAVIESVTVGMEGEYQEPTIVLSRGARLTGVVRAQDGAGIADAELHLDSMFFQAQGEPQPDRLTVRSDAQGSFSFENVPAGHRSMHVQAEGFANALINGLNFRDGDAIERDVTLEIAEMICGVVVSGGSQPVANAEVLALSFSNSKQQCRDSVRTGEDGRFCLERLAPGSYTIAVRAEGYQAGNQRRVQAGDTNLVIDLRVQAAVSGRVVDAATGAPVTSFTCTVRQTFDGVQATTPTSVVGNFEDPNGEFTLTNVPQGNYLIEAVAPGFAPGFSEPFRVVDGQSVSGVTVRLGKGGTMTGVVLGSDGAPVSRAKITTHANDWTASEFDIAIGEFLPTNTTRAEAWTDGEGRFTITSLKPERYQIRIRGAGLCEHVQADIDVPDGGTKDLGAIQLISGGSIEGTVLDQAGRPVSGARIHARVDGRTGGLPRFYQTKAGSDGRFAFSGVYPGSYVVQAQPPAGSDFLDELTARSASRNISVVDGQSSTVELKLGN